MEFISEIQVRLTRRYQYGARAQQAFCSRHRAIGLSDFMSKVFNE